MRSKIVISMSAAVLLVAAVLLLKTGPAPVADREVPSSAVLETDTIQGASSALNKDALGGENTGRSAAAAEAPGPLEGPAAQPLPAGFGRLEPGQEKAYLQAAPLNEQELRSAEALIRTFFKYGRGRASLNKLVKELEDAGLQPVLAKDSNPHTGKMLNVRTTEALEGTKYYHAVFFEDEGRNREPFAQHQSVELRASADCMVKAREIVERVFGKTLGQPVRVRGDEWIEWRVGDRSVWIHRLGLEDIRYDPINARTLADLGNCKAAIELIPEDEEQAHL